MAQSRHSHNFEKRLGKHITFQHSIKLFQYTGEKKQKNLQFPSKGRGERHSKSHQIPNAQKKKKKIIKKLKKTKGGVLTKMLFFAAFASVFLVPGALGARSVGCLPRLFPSGDPRFTQTCVYPTCVCGAGEALLRDPLQVRGKIVENALILVVIWRYLRHI
jgi:hypothetical protein